MLSRCAGRLEMPALGTADSSSRPLPPATGSSVDHRCWGGGTESSPGRPHASSAPPRLCGGEACGAQGCFQQAGATSMVVGFLPLSLAIALSAVGADHNEQGAFRLNQAYSIGSGCSPRC